MFKKLYEKTCYLMTPTTKDAERKIIAECNASRNRQYNRSGYSPLQRVFGIGHRVPADLTSDDQYVPDAVYDLAASDASFEESRRIREAAMKAFAELAIRERVEDSVRARPRTVTEFKPDDVVVVWKTVPPARRGRWVGPGVCIGTHHNSLWINMRGALRKCRGIQVKFGDVRRITRVGITQHADKLHEGRSPTGRPSSPQLR